MAVGVGRARYLADTSALARLRVRVVADRLGPLIVEGAVATCGTGILEVLYSARSGRDYREIADLLEGMPRTSINDEVIDRALRIQSELAADGQHRGVSIPDLLLAAAAVEAGLTVLHYDSDFDRLAQAGDLRAEWVVPRGSID